MTGGRKIKQKSPQYPKSLAQLIISDIGRGKIEQCPTMKCSRVLINSTCDVENGSCSKFLRLRFSLHRKTKWRLKLLYLLTHLPRLFRDVSI